MPGVGIGISSLFSQKRKLGFPSSELGFNFATQTSTVFPSDAWRDGLLGVYYNNRIKLSGGWNDAAAFPNQTISEQYDSANGGTSFTKIADAPWERRHSMVYGIMTAGTLSGKILMAGGDLFGPSGYQRDVWTFDDTNGWVQATSDWGVGLGDRVLMSGCAHADGYFYIGGGQVSYVDSTPTLGVYKTTDGVNFSFVANIPLSYFSAGRMVSISPTQIMFVGGGRYASPLSDNFNTSVIVLNTSNNTFSTTGSISGDQLGMYQTTCFYKSRVFLLGGSNPANGNADSNGNVSGLWWSSDMGSTWTRVLAPIATHAAAMTCSDTDLYIIPGNKQNYCVKITGVALPDRNPTLVASWYNALSIKPTPASITRLNTFVTQIGNVADFDVISLVAGLETDEQRLRPLKTTSPDVFAIITSVANDYTLNFNGFKANGGVINMKWNPKDDAVATSTNSQSVSIFNTSNEVGNSIEVGALANNNSETLIFSRYNDGNMYASSNNAGGGVFDVVASALGYKSIERYSGTNLRMVDETTVVEKTLASSAPDITTDFYLGGGNNKNSVSYFGSLRTQTCVLIFKSGLNHATIRTAILNYLNSAGVPLS